MYSFLFDRRSMALLLTCLAAAGLLLFAGGVLVGLQLQLDSSGPVTVAEFRPLAPSEPAAPAEPAQAGPSQPVAAMAPGEPSAAVRRAEPAPGIASEPTAPPLATQVPARPPSAAPAPVAKPEPQPLLAGEKPASPEAELTEQTIIMAAAPAPAPPARPAVLNLGRVFAAAPASLPAPAASAAARTELPVDESVAVLSHAELAGEDGAPTYGVQVAAFAKRATASQVAAELIRRGWGAYLVPFATASGRQMYSIRLGPFGTSREAYRAARDFEQRENAPTLVRLQLPGG